MGHLINRNCVTFAEELLTSLKVPAAFPTWIRGASDAAQSSIVFPIADYGWECAKWWNERRRAIALAELEARDAAAAADQEAGDNESVPVEPRAQQSALSNDKLTI